MINSRWVIDREDSIYHLVVNYSYDLKDGYLSCNKISNDFDLLSKNFIPTNTTRVCAECRKNDILEKLCKHF